MHLESRLSRARRERGFYGKHERDVVLRARGIFELGARACTCMILEKFLVYFLFIYYTRSRWIRQYISYTKELRRELKIARIRMHPIYPQVSLGKVGPRRLFLLLEQHLKLLIHSPRSRDKATHNIPFSITHLPRLTSHFSKLYSQLVHLPNCPYNLLNRQIASILNKVVARDFH